MLKSFWQITLRFVALTILAIAVTFNNPLLAQTTSGTEVTRPSSTVIRDDSKIICPDNNQGNKESSTNTEKGIPCVQTAKSKKPQSENPYDMEAIHKFDQELYGD
jgi:hypothetical protein